VIRLVGHDGAAPTGRALDLLLDDEEALEQALQPLLALVRHRRLSSLAAAAALYLVSAWSGVRRQQRA
jgi:hypothetical protein